MDIAMRDMRAMLYQEGVLKENEKMIRQIGCGQSAEVYLVLSEDGDIYALKIMKLEEHQIYQKHLRCLRAVCSTCAIRTVRFWRS